MIAEALRENPKLGDETISVVLFPLKDYPDDWKSRLRGLRQIDWRRTNKEWQGIAMSGPDVVNRRQNRMDTASFLKLKMGLKLTPAEERSIKGATDISSIMNNLRKFAHEPAAAKISLGSNFGG